MLLIRWIKEAGLTARIDTVGNVFARLEGDDPHAPAVLSGSHLIPYLKEDALMDWLV